MNKVLKYKLLLLFSLTTLLLEAQILLPNFESPERLEKLNTEAEEIAPVPFSNGQKLYFVRAVPEGKAEERKAGQDIWTSERVGDNWSEPQNVFEEVNDLGNNGVIGSSADGRKIYVFNSIQSRRKRARGIAYVEKEDDGTWSDLKKLKIDGFEIGDGFYSFYMNQAEDVLLISMAPDKKTINEDLFVSTKDSLGKWTEVISLGAKINTPAVELSPFITEDKNALYFASNGHGGEGDVDIFVSYRIGEGWNDWTTPKNLGPQINSSSFDAYFMIGNNKEVFFVSNRDSAKGDLYTTKLIEAKSVQLASNEVSGQFLYQGEPIEDINLEVYDQLGNLAGTAITDKDGKFTYKKLNPDENYFLKVALDDAANYPNAVFYELDPNGKKKSKYILTKTGLFVSANKIKDNESIAGTFRYNNLPLENTYVLVYNNDGDVIDTILTDASGNFNYKKLDPNADYTFKPLDIDDSDVVFIDITDSELNLNGNFTYNNLPLQNGALLVLDENGDIIDTIFTDSQGNFKYTKLSADNDYTFKPAGLEDNELAYEFTIQEPDENVIGGTMKYKNLPLINAPLLVKDENGIVIDTIYTNVNGEFNFKKLKGDQIYSFEALGQQNDPDLIDFALLDIEKESIQGLFQYKNLPQANTALVVYDENGFAIDTIYTNANGSFTYNRLNTDKNYSIKPQDQDDFDLEMVDLISFSKKGMKKVHYSSDEIASENLEDDLEIIIGLFQYNNSPLANTPLIIYDENGQPVDTVYTDSNGSFSFNRLKSDEKYSIKPQNQDDFDLDKIDLISFSKKGMKKIHYSSDEIASENLEDDLEIIVGLFQYNNLPQANSILLVFDEDGTVVDTIYTDVNGAFTYQKIKGDEVYSIKPMKEEEFDIAMLDIYSFNKKGLKKVYYPSNKLASENLEGGLEIIVGKFKYNNLPQANSILLIFDEDGAVIDTLYTDAFGTFNYKKLKGDDFYFIRPLKEEDFDVTMLDIYSTNEEGLKKVHYVSKVDFTTKENEKPSVNEKSELDPELFKKYILFEFEKSSKESSSIDTNPALDKIASYLVKNPNRRIRLNGHTCNMGTAKVNRYFSLQRANTVKTYLLNKGVRENQMEIKAILDAQPLVPNTSIKNRQQNRRVSLEMIN